MTRHRPALADIVCFNCDALLAREQDDATWAVKVLADGDITDKWPELVWTCWNCESEGIVNAFDMFPNKTHGRVRIPTRPLL